MSTTTGLSPLARRRRVAERRAETRLLLLQAAALLFARRGYHGVSLDEVADEAGFTKGAVYGHFSSKQDLLANLLEVYCERQQAEIRAIMAQPKSLDERLCDITSWCFRPPQEVADWFLLFIELWAQAMREPGLRPRMEQIQASARQVTAEMITAEAARLGLRLAVPAEDLARSLQALGDGLMMQHVLAPSDRTVLVYRSALRGMFRDATRSGGEEAIS